MKIYDLETRLNIPIVSAQETLEFSLPCRRSHKYQSLYETVLRKTYHFLSPFLLNEKKTNRNMYKNEVHTRKEKS